MKRVFLLPIAVLSLCSPVAPLLAQDSTIKIATAGDTIGASGDIILDPTANAPSGVTMPGRTVTHYGVDDGTEPYQAEGYGIPHIATNGDVVFRCRLSDGRDALCFWDATSTVTRIVLTGKTAGEVTLATPGSSLPYHGPAGDLTEEVWSIGARPAINANKQIIFRARMRASQQVVFVADVSTGTPTFTQAINDTGTYRDLPDAANTTFLLDAPVNINSHGNVAFGLTASSGGLNSSLYAGVPGAVQVVTTDSASPPQDTNPPITYSTQFENFFNYPEFDGFGFNINDENQIAFRLALKNFGAGDAEWNDTGIWHGAFQPTPDLPPDPMFPMEFEIATVSVDHSVAIDNPHYHWPVFVETDGFISDDNRPVFFQWVYNETETTTEIVSQIGTDQLQYSLTVPPPTPTPLITDQFALGGEAMPAGSGSWWVDTTPGLAFPWSVERDPFNVTTDNLAFDPVRNDSGATMFKHCDQGVPLTASADDLTASIWISPASPSEPWSQTALIFRGDPVFSGATYDEGLPTASYSAIALSDTSVAACKMILDKSGTPHSAIVAFDVSGLTAGPPSSQYFAPRLLIASGDLIDIPAPGSETIESRLIERVDYGFDDTDYEDADLGNDQASGSRIIENPRSGYGLLSECYGQVAFRAMANTEEADRSGIYVSSATNFDADWNQDGYLNDQDWFDWVNDFFSQTGPQKQYDFNEDGFENDQDWFDFVNAFFGRTAHTFCGELIEE